MDVSKHSEHVAIMKRSNTGTIIRHPMNSDEIELLSGSIELLKRMMEHFYKGFHLEYFEQIGMKKNEGDN